MPDIQAIALAAVLAFALGTLGGAKLAANHYTAIIATQRADSERELREATNRALDIERKHNALAAQLGVTHEENSREKDRILADNRRLARELGGLRDPGKRPACNAAVPANAAAPVDPVDDPAGSRLSDEASGFLLDFARECDHAADYAGTAHRWVRGLKAP